MTAKVFNDLREYINEVKQLGEYKVIDGAEWDLEIGAITKLQNQIPDSPLLLFDNIKGYKPGYQVAANVLNTPRRIALALGLPLETKGIEMVKAWRDRIKGEFKPIPPVEVSTGPVKENIHTGEEVDLFKFPVPRWNEQDGGRYIGTGCMVILRDPEEGWVNLGCYRVEAHDKSIATVHIVPHHHGGLIRKKYWDKGLSAPVAVVCGQEPSLWTASNMPVPWGVSEYDYAGWLRGKPVEVIKGEVTDLPIPATAEIVLEGEIVPPGGETRIEGPFGEWSGYSEGHAIPEQVFHVKAILHRNNPILMGSTHNVGPFDMDNGTPIMVSATIWNILDKQIPGIKGVWVSSEARKTLIIVSIKQMFPGHAKRVGMIVAEPTGDPTRFVIVVDDDIDPSNIGDVLWAMGTRCDPASAIDIISGCYSKASDPLLSPEKRARGEFTTSEAIINACKPYYWMNDFPSSTKSSPELLKRVKEKFLL